MPTPQLAFEARLANTPDLAIEQVTACNPTLAHRALTHSARARLERAAAALR